MKPIAWLLTLGAVLPPQEALDKPIELKSTLPVYQVTIPKGYTGVGTAGDPGPFLRSAGRESWAWVNVILRSAESPIDQIPAGITEAAILPYLALPPDSQKTFFTVRWMELNIGVIEYRTVVKNLRTIGRSAVLPVRGKAVILTVSAPDPLEKDVKEDFEAILSSFTGRSNWRTDGELETIRMYDRVAMAGAGLLLIYLPALATLFRGHPMKAFWLRTAWLVICAALLFIPVFSPGDTTILNNLLTNAMLPIIVLLFVVRRIKLAVET